MAFYTVNSYTATFSGSSRSPALPPTAALRPALPPAARTPPGLNNRRINGSKIYSFRPVDIDGRYCYTLCIEKSMTAE